MRKAGGGSNKPFGVSLLLYDVSKSLFFQLTLQSCVMCCIVCQLRLAGAHFQLLRRNTLSMCFGHHTGLHADSDTRGRKLRMDNATDHRHHRCLVQGLVQLPEIAGGHCPIFCKLSSSRPTAAPWQRPHLFECAGCGFSWRWAISQRRCSSR